MELPERDVGNGPCAWWYPKRSSNPYVTFVYIHPWQPHSCLIRTGVLTALDHKQHRYLLPIALDIFNDYTYVPSIQLTSTLPPPLHYYHHHHPAVGVFLSPPLQYAQPYQKCHITTSKHALQANKHQHPTARIVARLL